MAEEKKDSTTNDEPKKVEEVKEPTPKGVGETRLPQTEEAINEYIEDLQKNAIKAAKSQETVTCIDYEGKKASQEYNRCMLMKSKEVHEEYFSIKNQISATFLGHTTQLESNVNSYVSKADEAAKALESSLIAIKTAKDKLREVRDAACKFDADRHDSCNSEQLNALDKLGKDPSSGLKGIKRFQDMTDDIITHCGKLYENADNNFESGVKIAGIMASVNTGSLVDLASGIKSAAEYFDKDVDDNLTYSSDKIDSAQEFFTKGLEDLDKALFEKNSAHLTRISLDELCADLDPKSLKEKSPCPPPENETSKDDLKQIIESIKEILEEGIKKNNSDKKGT